MRFVLLIWVLLSAPALAEEVWGIPVTTGAAPGYVADSLCTDCHKDIAHAFTGHGMGNSFHRASSAKVIERFGPSYYHAPSDRHYRITYDQGYRFRRHRLAEDGTELDVFEAKVDWIVGSGNHSRIYLIQEPNGMLIQLPLAWYTQSQSWAMAPGYEFADHLGLDRVVKARCMACHNAYPDLPKGADAFQMPAFFPAELPEGIGCQRCHGPGAEHVGKVLDAEALGGVTEAEIRAAILNPVDLPRLQQRDLCYSCHYQPSVAVNGQLRLGRGAYSFRPGESLASHVAQIDVEDALRPPDHRFDINHHAYRLEQSACYTAQTAQPGCLSCHDPHGKAPLAERNAQRKGVCLECHSAKRIATLHPEDPQECTSCHMPRRRPQDVIEVTVTDHKIQRPVAGDPTARIAKLSPEVAGVSLIHAPPDLRAGEGLMYQTMAILGFTGGRDPEALAALSRAVEGANPPFFEPWLILAQSRMLNGDYPGALQAANRVARLQPGHAGAYRVGALTHVQMGDFDAARDLALAAAELSPSSETEAYNLGLIHRHLGERAEAIAAFTRAAQLRPTMWSAWLAMGEVRAEAGETGLAIEAFQTALSVNPAAHRAREGLIRALDQSGNTQEADRHRALLPK